MFSPRSIFFDKNGVRPVWRFLAFVAATFVVAYIIEGTVLLSLADKLRINLNALSPEVLLLSEMLDFIALIIVVGAAAALEHERIDSYGLPVRCAFRGKFWEGAIMGLVATALVGIGMLATGGMQIRGIALHGRDLVLSPVLWLLGMLFVGINEEYLFRGYPLQTLGRGIGFWPAAIVTSALFAGDHLTKPHENAIDIGMIFVLAILMCFTVARTGTLWLAVGLHAAFDFGQLFIIGSPNAGRVPAGRLFDVSFPGAAWSNGGELGTEASLFMIPVVLILFAYIHFRYPKTQVALQSR
jgi:CAAX protease family protein